MTNWKVIAGTIITALGVLVALPRPAGVLAVREVKLVGDSLSVAWSASLSSVDSATVGNCTVLAPACIDPALGRTQLFVAPSGRISGLFVYDVTDFPPSSIITGNLSGYTYALDVMSPEATASWSYTLPAAAPPRPPVMAQVASQTVDNGILTLTQMVEDIEPGVDSIYVESCSPVGAGQCQVVTVPSPDRVEFVSFQYPVPTTTQSGTIGGRAFRYGLRSDPKTMAPNWTYVADTTPPKPSFVGAVATTVTRDSLTVTANLSMPTQADPIDSLSVTICFNNNTEQLLVWTSPLGRCEIRVYPRPVPTTKTEVFKYGIANPVTGATFDGMVHLMSYRRALNSGFADGPFMSASIPPAGGGTPATITVNPGTQYQTIKGWESNGNIAEDNALVSQNYNRYALAGLTMAVNDVGVTRIQLTIQSGAENTLDNWTLYTTGQIDYATWRARRYATVNDNADPNSFNWSGFHFAQTDHKINKVILPLRTLMAARGEALSVTLTYVAFTGQIVGGSYIHDNAAEYAEFILAHFIHMQQTFGFVPDAVEVILEPDNVTQWTQSVHAAAITAVKARLNAAGFTPELLTPGTAGMANALTRWNAFSSSVKSQIGTFLYHRYNGVTAANVQAIGALGVPTAMTEWWAAGNDYKTLHEDLKIANNAAWQQGTLIGFTSSSTPSLAAVALDTLTWTVSVSPKSKLTRQYYLYVRPGAKRIAASSTNAALDPLAFIRPDGRYVLVVKSTGAASFTAALPAGTYGITYATGSVWNVAAPDQTIATGQNITTSIPAAGVLTIFPKTGGTPPPPPPPTVPPTPTGVTTIASGTTITTAWNDVTGETGYELQRCTGASCSNFVAVATVGANITMYADAGLTASTTYCYRVRSTNSAGASTPSTSSCAQTATAPPPPPPTSWDPERPRILMAWTDTIPRTTQTVTLTASSNLQAALNAACGTEIIIPAGTVFRGNFTIPATAPSCGWNVVRSSGTLPALGKRIHPADSTQMYVIETNNSSHALTAADRSHHWRFIGGNIRAKTPIYAGTGRELTYAIVNVGPSGRWNALLADIPTHIVFDRMFIHGHDNLDTQRCMYMEGQYQVVIDSWLSDCHYVGFDAQAIAGNVGPGPYKIVNNHLEGSGENVLFGGAGSASLTRIPSDIEIRNNYFFKPLSWLQGHPTFAGNRWSVKNLFELKTARRVWIENNIFENNWVHAQAGGAILFQEVDGPNSRISDVDFRDNYVLNSPGLAGFCGMGVNNGGLPTEPCYRIRWEWNVFQLTTDPLLAPQLGNTRAILLVGQTQGSTVRHNTIWWVNATGAGAEGYYHMAIEGTNRAGTTVTDNVFCQSVHHLVGSGVGGPGVLTKYDPTAVFEKNVHFDATPPATATRMPNNTYVLTNCGAAMPDASGHVGTDGQVPGARPWSAARINAVKTGR